MIAGVENLPIFDSSKDNLLGLRADRFRMDFQPQGLHHLENRVKTGASLARKRPVQALTRQTGISRHLRHPLPKFKILKPQALLTSLVKLTV